MAGRLDKTIKGIKSIDVNEVTTAGLAVVGVGASSALLSSLGRYSTNFGPLNQVSQKLGPDGRLALQSGAIMASGFIVTEMMLADLKGGLVGDMTKKKTRDLIQFSAIGIAMYRLLTGLQAGGIGSAASGVFDGHLNAVLGRQGPLLNTPAQLSQFKQAVNSVEMPVVGNNNNTKTVHSMNPRRLREIMSP
tara:strand:+ start:59 stop:631 length:573 start_codon:yes stop_codon:yes gene_type:complete